MKNTDTATTGKRERNRTNSTGSTRKIRILDVRSPSTERTREGGDKCSRSTRRKNGDVPNGIHPRNNKKDTKSGISDKL